MRVGSGHIFQNPFNKRTDLDLYQHEMRLADISEGLGFDSIWGVEHHFTDYTLCPDVTQWLTWVAARTEHAQIGSMVVVLPWHDPLRVAEEVAMLDTLSNGRMILGIGRGLGRVEFEGFRVSMDETRARFIESAGMVLEGLEKGYVEGDGEFYKQPRRDVRPAPFKTFRGRTYAAAISPETMKILAELGVGMLILPQKPWDQIGADLESYRSTYREVQGEEAPTPIVASFTYCDEDAGRAEEVMRKHMDGYYDSMLRHYELQAEHFGEAKGYEYYKDMSKALNKYGTESAGEFFLNLQVFGTPEQCLEKIRDTMSKTGGEHFVATFAFGGIPYEDAERSMRLFAKEVMPELQGAAVTA